MMMMMLTAPREPRSHELGDASSLLRLSGSQARQGDRIQGQ